MIAPVLSGHRAKDIVESFAFMGDRGHKLLLEKGEHFLNRTPVKEVPEAKKWASREHPKKKECFMNAQKFCISHLNTKYYEGYWAASLVPVWHGWVVLDGKVIDFTAEACEKYLKKQGHDFPDAETLDYFGVHIPTEFILKRIVDDPVWTDRLSDYLRTQS